MIERQPRDHARQWAFHHVGGVKAAAKPDFEQQNVSRVAGEQQKCRRRLHLKHRDRGVSVADLAFGEHIGEFVIAHEPAAARLGDAETFIEANQIGRGVDVDALIGRFQDRAHERDGGSFAVGTGNMDERRQTPFGMTKRSQETLDTRQRQIDTLGMQRQQSRVDGVDRSSAGSRRGHAGAGRLKRGFAGPAGAFNNNRQSRAMVARKLWRCTTMSTMPWARRYSDF